MSKKSNKTNKNKKSVKNKGVNKKVSGGVKSNKKVDVGVKSDKKVDAVVKSTNVSSRKVNKDVSVGVKSKKDYIDDTLLKGTNVKGLNIEGTGVKGTNVKVLNTDGKNVKVAKSIKNSGVKNFKESKVSTANNIEKDTITFGRNELNYNQIRSDVSKILIFFALSIIAIFLLKYYEYDVLTYFGFNF